MIRSIIPPRTMSTVWQERHQASGTAVQVTPIRKLRQWQYQTKPSLKQVRGPLVDVFSEAEEVLIVIDLGGFTRGEISLSRTPEHYIVQAARGEQRFRELIDMPPNVDLEHSQERLVNGVLEIVLPHKTVRRRPKRKPVTRAG